MARLPKDLGVTFCIYTDLKEIWALVKEKPGNQDNAGPRDVPNPIPIQTTMPTKPSTPPTATPRTVSGKDTQLVQGATCGVEQLPVVGCPARKPGQRTPCESIVQK